MIDSYITCVSTELDAMIQVYNKHIIPRCITQNSLNSQNQNGLLRLKHLFKDFENAFDQLL